MWPFAADFELAELSEYVCQELDLETSKNLRQHDELMMGAAACSPRRPHLAIPRVSEISLEIC